MRAILLLIALILFPTASSAQELSYNDFSALPVQHEGRIKPVDTFARALLQDFSGHTALGNMDADAWLAETLFDPAQALHRPVFRVLRPDFLDLPAREKKYYSYAEIARALSTRSKEIDALSKTEEKDWNPDQREVMRLFEASMTYTQLLRSFSFALPLNITLPASLAKEWKVTEERPFTLDDYRKFEPRLSKKVKDIIRRKGEDPSKYNRDELAVAQFAMDIQTLETAGRDNALLRIIPGATGEEWFSPWSVTQSGQGSPAGLSYLRLWQDMAAAYQTQDAAEWNDAVKKAKAAMKDLVHAPLSVEISYNKFSPLRWAGAFYMLALFAFAAHSLRGASLFYRLAAGFCAIGALLHFATITARIFILDRPPVGTLYESVLFVALICVMVGLILEYVRKDGNGLLIGALSGLILLFISGSLAAGDTMKMLVAVLNTNFWLSTHVLCITMGYGWSLVAAALAHLWLLRRGEGNLTTPVKIITLTALLFTSVGTALGGIWADQSWGRFWGWDPKENGALLIVLWIAWAIHGQIGGQLSRIAFMSMISFLSVVVALAWFGVNLLSVGLHSYGFITGVAAALAVFCAVETVLIGFLWLRCKRLMA